MATVASPAYRVYLDTTVLKNSIDRIEVWTPVEETVNWGGRAHSVTVHKPAVKLPIENQTNEVLKSEARLLRRIAELAKEGRIELLVQIETKIELWGLQRTGVGNTLFFGAPITEVEAPFEYSRVTFAAFQDTKKAQYEFLSRITHKRFVELQKACGAYQGAKPLSPNQLRDAFHVWCAEGADAQFFLTTDFKLIGHVQRQQWFIPKVRLVKPSELLAEIDDERPRTRFLSKALSWEGYKAMDFLKGILLLIGFCAVVWMIFKWSEDLCLDGGTYCQQNFCGDPQKIKACEQASIERWEKASPEEKAKTKRIIELGTK